MFLKYGFISHWLTQAIFLLNYMTIKFSQVPLFKKHSQACPMSFVTASIVENGIPSYLIGCHVRV